MDWRREVVELCARLLGVTFEPPEYWYKKGYEAATRTATKRIVSEEIMKARALTAEARKAKDFYELEKKRMKHIRLAGGPMQVSRRMKGIVLSEGKNKCIYCGGIAHTVDHIVPVSQGGTNARYNLAACCGTCNADKGDMSYTEYCEYLKYKYARPEESQSNPSDPGEILDGKS